MNPNDDLDRILDQALNEYRDAEPLAGMEDRILRRIAAQPEPSPRRWAWILAAAGAGAVIVFALWLGLRERPHQQPVVTNVTQPTQQATASAAHVDTSASPSGPSRPVAKARVAHPTGRETEVGRERAQPQSPKRNTQSAQATAKPVLKQFPAPQPMTREEHALLALARTHPDALLAPRDDADQLTIVPIEIKPLAPEAGAPQGEQP